MGNETTKHDADQFFGKFADASVAHSGDFNARVCRAVAKRVVGAGYTTAPIENSVPADEYDLFQLIATVESEQTGTFTASIVRKAAQEIASITSTPKW